MYPAPVTSKARAVAPGAAPVTHFVRTITASPTGAPVLVHLEALRDVVLYVNDQRLPPVERASWKREAVLDVSAHVVSGANVLRADVTNPLGPALLFLWVEGVSAPFATDATWRVAEGSGTWADAIVADDTRINPDALTMPTPVDVLSAKWVTLAVIFVVLTTLALVIPPTMRERYARHAPAAALVAVHLAWLSLWFHGVGRMRPEYGYDATGHLDYVKFILRHRALPLATDGWSMHHPPLFYVISAALASIARPGAPETALTVTKVTPFLCGLGNVWVAYVLARRIFDGEPIRVALAVLFAGTLPMNVYMSAYVSNESLHGLLAGLAIVATVGVLAEPQTRTRSVVLVGILAGLAVLAKATALVLMPVVAAFVAVKLRAVDRATPGRTTALLALLCACVVAVAGWFFARNVAYFGRPLVLGGWDVPGGLTPWWQVPGFHTIRYYTGFGESLVHPYFASLHSFWDGLYSTCWGDGGIGGQAFVRGRPREWDYDYMSAAYLLAVPATFIVLVGMVQTMVSAWTTSDPRTKLVTWFLVSVLWIVGCAMVNHSLRGPMYSTAKAIFGLCLIGPASVAWAVGFEAVARAVTVPRWPAARAVLQGWLGTLMAIIYLAYRGP